MKSNPIGFLRKNDYPLFLPPKTVSAVRLYGDVTIFDDSASFLSLPVSERLKKAQTEKALRKAKIARNEKAKTELNRRSFSIITVLIMVSES